jgi:alkyl hydroperoxide reductase subunit AhpC
VWLASLAARRARLDELGIAVLVFVPDPLPVIQRMALDLDIPFPLLADEDGRVARRYGAVASDGAPGVAVCAADRYGYALAAWRAKEADAMPSLDAALDRIAFAAMEDCGCGLPAWPEDAMEPMDS